MIAIIDAIIAGKYAKNEFQAAAIANGLQLYALETEEECMARVRLYRAWRDSGVFGKETAPCFEKAIAGEKVPELFDKKPTEDDGSAIADYFLNLPEGE